MTGGRGLEPGSLRRITEYVRALNRGRAGQGVKVSR
jgi:hypothetical protein